MQKRMLEVPSTDGVHTLRGILYLPQEAPRALIQISHGMTEHIARYEAFMEYLASLGYAVCGHDHIGHGKTAENDSELGFFAQKDGWSILPGDTTIHAAVLDSTGQLQNDWDTKINPGRYEEGGPVRITSNEQKDGYLCFYVDGKHGKDGASYELNLATGEVNRT